MSGGSTAISTKSRQPPPTQRSTRIASSLLDSSLQVRLMFVPLVVVAVRLSGCAGATITTVATAEKADGPALPTARTR